MKAKTNFKLLLLEKQSINYYFENYLLQEAKFYESLLNTDN